MMELAPKSDRWQGQQIDPLSAAKPYIEKGYALRTKDQVKEAIQSITSAIEILQGSGTTEEATLLELAKILTGRSQLLRYEKSYELALSDCLTAQKILSSLKTPDLNDEIKFAQAVSSQSEANIYFATQEPERGFQAITRAIELFRGDFSELRQNEARGAVLLCLLIRASEYFSKAYDQKALDDFNEIKSLGLAKKGTGEWREMMEGIAACCNNLGQSELESKNHQAAKKYLRKAYHYFAYLGRENPERQPNDLIRLYGNGSRAAGSLANLHKAEGNLGNELDARRGGNILAENAYLLDRPNLENGRAYFLDAALYGSALSKAGRYTEALYQLGRSVAELDSFLTTFELEEVDRQDLTELRGSVFRIYKSTEEEYLSKIVEEFKNEFQDCNNQALLKVVAENSNAIARTFWDLFEAGMDPKVKEGLVTIEAMRAGPGGIGGIHMTLESVIDKDVGLQALRNIFDLTGRMLHGCYGGSGGPSPEELAKATACLITLSERSGELINQLGERKISDLTALLSNIGKLAANVVP